MRDIFKEYREFSRYDESPTEYSDHTMSYEQNYCPDCGGKIDSCFQCMKCGKQYHPPRNDNVMMKEGICSC